jgi:hypothetical protein
MAPVETLSPAHDSRCDLSQDKHRDVPAHNVARRRFLRIAEYVAVAVMRGATRSIPADLATEQPADALQRKGGCRPTLQGPPMKTTKPARTAVGLRKDGLARVAKPVQRSFLRCWRRREGNRRTDRCFKNARGPPNGARKSRAGPRTTQWKLP